MLHKSDLDAAEKYCDHASRCWMLALGKDHPCYLLTTHIFSEIYKARGLFEDSAICLDLIPDASILAAGLPEIHSYKGEALDLLKNQGLDTNSPQFDPDSALRWAIAEGHEAVVRYILTKGVPMETKSQAEPLLHHAVLHGQETVVQYY